MDCVDDYALYTAPGSAGMLVHWVLLELNQPPTLALIDLAGGAQRTPDYLSLNPQGVVPTLRCDNGQVLFESSAIVMWLADQHPESRLAPNPSSPDRALYYQWMIYLAATLQPQFRLWFTAERVLDGGAVTAVKTAVLSQIESIFAILDAQLASRGPYLLGESPCAADFLLTMMMRWSRNMPKPATSWSNLASLANLMRARPSFTALYQREGLTEWA